MSTGIDLRLMEGEEFRRTQLQRDAPLVQARAEEWKTALTAKGWTWTPRVLAALGLSAFAATAGSMTTRTDVSW